MPSRRAIPSLERLLERPALAALAGRFGRDRVVDAARRAADDLRRRLAPDANAPETADRDDDVAARLERAIETEMTSRLSASLRTVINATGVIVHTNLGRAPLAASAIAAAARVGGGYSNLEYDLQAGGRGHRHQHAEGLVAALTGAEASVVVNNNAAAVLLALAALAEGREVIVSRGELVEIGGGFRVPDICAQSGAVLREVGTTNRTRAADYAAAIGDRTAVLLRVHPSNFRIEGFTERPALTELVALARRFSLPVVEDLGSGWLGDAPARIEALRDEPSVPASIAAGADVVAFSGDKLLGGPQAGVIAGRRDLIDRIGRHPLMRAVRADKLAYAALEATLSLWASPADRAQIPVYRMLVMPLAEIERRARRLTARLDDAAGVRAEVIDGESAPGGGSAPGSGLPTRLVAVSVDGLSAADLERRLRAHNPPIIARIADDVVCLDLRTVSESDDAEVASALTGLAAS